MALRPLLDADVIQEMHERNFALDEDTYELFEMIEDSFGVELGDYRALCGLTITKLAHEVSQKANYPNREKCLSAVAFYRLRHAFQVLFAIPRAAIRPNTPLAELLPWKSRRAQWSILRENLGLTLPELTLPYWLFWLCVATPAALLVCLKAWRGFPPGWLATFAGWIALIVLALRAATPFAGNLPRDTETIAGLTKVILARNYAAFAKQTCGSSEDDVLSALQQLIATVMIRSVEEIPPYTLIPQG